VPPSVQTVLAARIDRLPADQKAILQTASVIGRTFDPAVLRTVSGSTTGFLEDALSSLCAAEMLQNPGHDPVSEYRFWHPLTQEVAYESLLRDHRRTLHATVANALAQLDPARNDERAALIASHFARADALLAYARWEDKAAAWSQRVEFSEAVERWRNALAALDKLPRNDETTETRGYGPERRRRPGPHSRQDSGQLGLPEHLDGGTGVVLPQVRPGRSTARASLHDPIDWVLPEALG
jgi:adenylate cyclase